MAVHDPRGIPEGRGGRLNRIRYRTLFHRIGSRRVHPERDIHGTVFQEKVWRALQQIPPGETRSYTEIAHAIDLPRAVRAVANACGRNKLAVAVPCHRVIRGDRELGGYRWGINRKKELLEKESASGL